MISKFFPCPAVGVIFDKYFLSKSHNLAYVDPAGNLDSCSGTLKESKIHIIM